jgi:serine/threonine protein kinase
MVVSGNSDRAMRTLPLTTSRTTDYIAPEIDLSRPHSFSADYWSLGAMLYEFMVGAPPFRAGTHRRAVIGDLRRPGGCSISPKFRDPLGHACIGEIALHPWLADAAEEPPFVPQASDCSDTAYFAQRYEFNDAEDAALLEDFQGCAPPGMESFRSVDLAVLVEANEGEENEFPAADRRRRAGGRSQCRWGRAVSVLD